MRRNAAKLRADVGQKHDRFSLDVETSRHKNRGIPERLQENIR